MSINCDCPLNIEHCDHTLVKPNQSEQISFPNHPLLCLLLLARAPLLLLTSWRRWEKLKSLTRTRKNWSSWNSSWNLEPHFEYPNNHETFLSSRMDSQWDGLNAYFVYILPWDWDPDALERTCWQDQKVLNLLKGQALYYSKNHLKWRMEPEDSDLPDNELIEEVITDLCIK
jgi:hypothetical protein